MFFKEDKTFQNIREKSVEQWLGEMHGHSDIEVRGGVQATKDYIEYLKTRNKQLEDKYQLAEGYLKQLKSKA